MFKRWIAIMLCVIMLFALVTVTSAENQSFFRCHERDILDRGGNPFLIKGIALSGWLVPEAYMLGLKAMEKQTIGSPSGIKNRIREILDNDTDAQEFWDTYQKNFVTEQDIADFADKGFNTIRLPFNYRLLSPEDTPDEYCEDGFKVLDRVIQWCKNHDLYVILDLHCCPGGQSNGNHADPEHWDEANNRWVAGLWEYNQDYYDKTNRTPESNKNQTVNLWRKIAKRYKDEEWIIGYELINEANLTKSSNCSELWNLSNRTIKAIRGNDTNHIIFVGGNYYASEFTGFEGYERMDPHSNMALVFHKYWVPPKYEEIRNYVNISNKYNLPFLMSESGENSSPWFYEFKQLLEDNNIGWCWWGWKKTDSITSAYSVNITPDYKYVVENFDNYSIDRNRAKRGLMDLANNINTTKCDYRPGYFFSLLDPHFNKSSQPYTNHTIPGIIQCVDYDIGNQNVAYYDNIAYHDNSTWWNEGWSYRNDWVDIQKINDTDNRSCGYNVGWTEDGEWMKYTVNVFKGGNYTIAFRVASENNNGAFKLLLNDSNLICEVDVNNTGAYQEWETQNKGPYFLPDGMHTLKLQIVTGGFNIAWIEIR
jgi:endoglucanase